MSVLKAINRECLLSKKLPKVILLRNQKMNIFTVIYLPLMFFKVIASIYKLRCLVVSHNGVFQCSQLTTLDLYTCY